jgi:hypothetical protein
MSYSLTLDCGCSVYVSCDPKTNTAHTRVLESRGTACTVRKHEIGFRLYLWDLLPDRGAAQGQRPSGEASADDLVAWV